MFINQKVCIAIAGATLAGTIASASPAGAVVFTYNGLKYDVTTHSFNGNDAFSGTNALNSPLNALWGNQSLANGLASVVGCQLGGCYVNPTEINGNNWAGAYFAYATQDTNVYASPNTILSLASIKPNHSDALPYIGEVQHSYNINNWNNPNRTFARAVAVPVPWDISGSGTILGSMTGIGLGVGLKRLKGKKTSRLTIS
ncbi:hypothetical protein PN480_09040 [Dolichospermum circinale CS-1225]|uniref:Uncharacterized protein n=1 Tax=Dolichospermum circinale CS-537/01 TaxID=3021739 RepID=A0ABT5A1H0_9CYAN|nr:hypothetical protein [Dolichospermum circinale]MDB9485067.1 hypothetical protein [Dolichospermum circinale CS-537/01]MDB9522095.1 hypothetical protein [Dolichospermum circinale CS-1225]